MNDVLTRTACDFEDDTRRRQDISKGHRHVNELGVTERLITGYDDRP
jgi:hypothetical protein